jgi:hypothetical protein
MTILDPLPHSAYVVIGVLVLMNLGAIGSMVWAAGRIIWYFAKQDSKVTEARNVGIRAHKRIDEANIRIDNVHRRFDDLDGK